jgi:transketolase
VITKGKDLAIIATGETVYPAVQAARKLKEEHQMEVTVVSMHTIKPLDYNLLQSLSQSVSAIMTVEEHSVYGGLGEACASFLLENQFNKPFKIIGIPDEYTVTGSQTEILNHYGISEEGLTATALQLIQKK